MHRWTNTKSILEILKWKCVTLLKIIKHYSAHRPPNKSVCELVAIAKCLQRLCSHQHPAQQTNCQLPIHTHKHTQREIKSNSDLPSAISSLAHAQHAQYSNKILKNIFALANKSRLYPTAILPRLTFLSSLKFITTLL